VKQIVYTYAYTEGSTQPQENVSEKTIIGLGWDWKRRISWR
jgi:hypothetical protein